VNQPPVIGLSISQVAIAYGVSSSTVRRWMRRGLPYVQPIPHGRVLIRQQDLDVFLKAQQHSEVTMDRMIGEVLTSLQTKPQKSVNSPAVT
jgi:predicted site-specific integrase-resolvase